jgi:competence transcription factor ComK
MQVGGIIHTQQKTFLNLQSFSPSYFFPNLHKTFSSMYIHLQHIHHYTLNKLKNGNTEFRNGKSDAVDLSTQQLVQFSPFSDDTFLYVFLFFSPLSS